MTCNNELRIFCKIETLFKGINNPNEAAKASSDVLEYLGWPIGCFASSVSVLLFPFDFCIVLADVRIIS